MTTTSNAGTTVTTSVNLDETFFHPQYKDVYFGMPPRFIFNRAANITEPFTTTGASIEEFVEAKEKALHNNVVNSIFDYVKFLEDHEKANGGWKS